MHDFKKHPELRNNQLDIYYFESPHKQIFENFKAKVIKVTDGDTIRVETDFRNFDFPIRLAKIAAPELDEGGLESAIWLRDKLLGKQVEILINKNNRVGKWGRLIGEILSEGFNINEASIREGQSIPFGEIPMGKLISFERVLEAYIL